MELYNQEKEWIKTVRDILIKFIPEIQNIMNNMSGYTYLNKFEYGGCDRYAWLCNDKLKIQTQNFQFIITDNDTEFNIEYEILDEYTREHCQRMYAISSKAHFIQIFKMIENRIFNDINYRNYKWFEYFIGEITTLMFALNNNNEE